MQSCTERVSPASVVAFAPGASDKLVSHYEGTHCTALSENSQTLLIHSLLPHIYIINRILLNFTQGTAALSSKIARCFHICCVFL